MGRGRNLRGSEWEATPELILRLVLLTREKQQWSLSSCAEGFSTCALPVEVDAFLCLEGMAFFVQTAPASATLGVSLERLLTHACTCVRVQE